jgi:hypothetical protein
MSRHAEKIAYEEGLGDYLDNNINVYRDFSRQLPSEFRPRPRPLLLLLRGSAEHFLAMSSRVYEYHLCLLLRL